MTSEGRRDRSAGTRWKPGWPSLVSRARRALPRALGLPKTKSKEVCVVLTQEVKNPRPVAFSNEDRARRYLRFLRRQQEAAKDDPTKWRVARVPLDPGPAERPGAWVVCIDRDGRPLGPARFSLARHPDDPPHELDFRSDVKPIRGVRDFVGYGRSRAEARESAEELRKRSIRPEKGPDS